MMGYRGGHPIIFDHFLELGVLTGPGITMVARSRQPSYHTSLTPAEFTIGRRLGVGGVGCDEKSVSVRRS